MAVEPSIRRAHRSPRDRLHIILRVEMRPRVRGRTYGMDEGQMPFAINGLQRSKRGMKGEKSIEVDCPFVAGTRWFGNRDLWTHGIVILITERHDHGDAVRGTSLENSNEDRMIFCRTAK